MNRRFLSSCVVGVIGAMTCVNSASAVTTLTAEADAYIELGASDTNFGLNPNLTVKDSNNSGTTRKAYIRFDLSGIDLPNVVAASFDLTVAQRSPGGSGDQTLPSSNYNIEIWGLNNGNAGEFWIEGNGGTGNSPAGEIDWANAPAHNTGNEGFLTAQATLLGSYVIPGNASVGDLFTLSNANLLNFIKADTNGVATLMVRRLNDTGQNNLSFASRDNTAQTGPQLNLTIIPEPATMSLIGLAGLAMLRRRREA